MDNIYTLEKFEENGFASPFDLSEENKDIDFEKEYFSFQQKSIEKFGKKVSVKPNLLSTIFDRLAFDTKIIEKVKKIIGDDIYIWSSAFFFKAPNDGKIVSYHQDNPYWQLTTDNVITAWIAFTVSNKECGALEIVPRSYKHGLLNNLDVDDPRASYLKGVKTTPESDLLSYNQNLDDFIKKNPPVVINLKPGQFSLHHVNAVHGSGTNLSNKNRIGFAVRYITAETKHKTENQDSAIHVCGQKNTYFKDELRPISNFSKESIISYNDAMQAAGSFGNKKY